MKDTYISFFEMLPSSAQITIKLLVPNKYAVCDTMILACVGIQCGVIKKKIVENLKSYAEKIISQYLKSSGKSDTVSSFSDIEISDELVYLIDNVNNYMRMLSDRANTELVSNYLSYMLISCSKLNSFKFFQNCLYTKYRDSLIDEMQSAICSDLGITLSDTLKMYGEYLMTPIEVSNYTCFERDHEIRSVAEILCRKQKNNAILVGQPGVGKTSIVYGLCNFLQSSECPECLLGNCVFSLNTNKIVSGTTYRGDMEKRIEDILSELEHCPNTIVFIDEAHTLLDRPSGKGDSSSIQNALKPFLSGRSKIICATTNQEYKIIEKDAAFLRRFAVVHVYEPSNETAVKTLVKAKHDFEEFHNIKISEDICRYAVDVSNRYIKNRYLPDKAIDIIDGASVISKTNGESELSKQSIDIYVENTSGVPKRFTTVDNIDLIEKDLCEQIVGQDHVARLVCKSLKKYVLGITDQKRPIASFLFVGKTGVGKTEMCKQIAKSVFSKDSFIRLDMSEYMDSNSVSKIIGSPPGYVGYDDGGTLTERVKHNPFSLIVFDEIEKAHADVVNILLQILDDGRLTDSFGDTTDFTNCMIILTSNIGCSKDMHKSVGFTNDTNDNTVMDAVKKYFSPEILGRISDICLFNDIDSEMLNRIISKCAFDIFERYEKAGIQIPDKDAVLQSITDKCKQTSYGVRDIKKSIESVLDDTLFGG